ncbi:MAG: galactonate dehydratase, partial [Natronomonas sp.]|nr:galactonate dehydratase [Natronomonas sp.]
LMSAVVLGANPHAIGDLWQMMYRGGFYRGGPILMSAIAGIDQALWDIKGKSLGAPVHTLLGGALRERIPVYQWIGGDRPAEVVDAAIARRDQGFTAVKMNATAEFDRIAAPAAVDAVATRLGAVRRAVGKEFNIALDFHGRVSRSAAPRLLAALEPHAPMFVEEPVLPTQPSELARLSAQTTVPIATGERLYSRWDFRPLLESQAADIIQPDISHAGGISEVAKIAAMAETYDVALAPHCPLGPI